MKIARLFKNGQSQAVRLPKEFRFSGDKVFVKKWGNGVILLPHNDTWDSLYEGLNLFTEDFMQKRTQGKQKKRQIWADVFAGHKYLHLSDSRKTSFITETLSKIESRRNWYFRNNPL